jgi:hypothetical protein
MRIVDVVEITKPIASPIRNAYIDFSKMTASLVAVVTDVIRWHAREMVWHGCPAHWPRTTFHPACWLRLVIRV